MTGVSLQTLHPTKFDHGTVLDQTPCPGIRHNASTVSELVALLAPMGAEMLVRGIREGVYLPPFTNKAQQPGSEENHDLRLAPKVRSEDRHVQWHTWNSEEILRRARVIGPLWSNTTRLIAGKPQRRRIIWTSGFLPSTGKIPDAATGHPIVAGLHTNSPKIYIRTCDNELLQADSIKLEGEDTSNFHQAAVRAGMINVRPAPDGEQRDYVPFHAHLD